MVPNLANVAKNHCFPKNLPIFWQYFKCQKFAIFQTPIMTININKFYHINTTALESTAQIMSEYDLLLEELL